jgi:type IV secretion system protein VirD4
MLDEFPALGRLDFFESALAFQAGYGIRAFLIAQSMNQLAKAYGENNAILDNCHIRIAFACNDERTAKRISDALGTTTEQRAMKNYAGHRLAPWLSHLMVSRQETSRALLTSGEVMQLPATDEILMVAGVPPVRAKKLRYYAEPAFQARVVAPPALAAGAYADRPPQRPDDWSASPPIAPDETVTDALPDPTGAGGGIRQEPALPEHEAVAPPRPPANELAEVVRDEPDELAARQSLVAQQVRAVARQAALDPGDDMQMG